MSLFAKRWNSCAVRFLRSSPSLVRVHRIATTQQNYPKTRRYGDHPHHRSFSTPSSVKEVDTTVSDVDGPWGDLFESDVSLDLLGKKASIRRTFDAQSNALGLLICGGEALAKHASFDPQYDRARDWIQHHAVGPAVLSPVLICGLVGALVEAAVPKAVPMASSMRQIRPLVVGVEVCATVEVVSVADPEELVTEEMTECTGTAARQEDVYERSNGFQVCLSTSVARVRDGAPIAQGTHSIWIPDYLHM